MIHAQHRPPTEGLKVLDVRAAVDIPGAGSAICFAKIYDLRQEKATNPSDGFGRLQMVQVKL
jgi:hypothetical protein